MKIKVCHVITKLELGGAQANTLYTCAHLDPQAFEVVLVTGRGGILDKEAAKLPRTVFCPWLVRPVNPLKDFFAFLFLVRFFKKEKPDVVHTHSSKAGILGRAAAAYARVPVVLHTFHGFGFHPYQKPWVRGFYVFLERVLARFAHRLIAVSHELVREAQVLKIGRPSQYVVIHSGIHRKLYTQCSVDQRRKKVELKLDPDRPVVLMVAPFKAQKNILGFLKLAAKLAPQKPAQFVLVGDGEERPAIEREILRLGLGESVRLLGWRRDMPEIYAASDVFALTSLWEGLPRSILEAMASGVPVVAHAVDGVKEILKDGENGYSVPPLDVDTMAQRVLSLLNDPALRSRFIEAGRKSVDLSFDIDEMVKQQERLYSLLSFTKN